MSDERCIRVLEKHIKSTQEMADSLANRSSLEEDLRQHCLSQVRALELVLIEIRFHHD